MLRIPGEGPPRASSEWIGVEMKLPTAGHTPELSQDHSLLHFFLHSIRETRALAGSIISRDLPRERHKGMEKIIDCLIMLPISLEEDS